MWNKKIVVTAHAQQRFLERRIKFSKKNSNVVKQILMDLKPLNVRTINEIEKGTHKVTTKQGKIYVIVENTKACFVKTVYKDKYHFEKSFYM